MVGHGGAYAMARPGLPRRDRRDEVASASGKRSPVPTVMGDE
jgi:hypothetical protein